MAVHGTDQRTVVTDFTTSGNSSIVAVDSVSTAPTSGSPSPNPGVGSGIQIADNFILTAGHNFYDVERGSQDPAGRVTAGALVDALASRPTTGLTEADINVIAANVTYVNGYNSLPVNATPGAQFDRDIALVQTTGVIGATNIGMVVYLDADDANGIDITTSGFPAGITPGSGSVNSGTVVGTSVSGADLTEALLAYTSSGTITGTTVAGQFEYSDDVDTEPGQSGSGVWTEIDDGTGSMVSVVVGVHTNSGNGGHLITENEYVAITNAMDGNVTNADNLPMSFIVGTDDSFFSFLPFVDDGSDIIQGSFLDEGIMGRGGDDRIEGRGGDDRIEGGDGVDHARFSGDISEYTFTILDATDPNAPTVQIAHTGGTMQDGTDITVGTEFAVFSFEDTQTRGQTGFGQDDDGSVFYVPLLADENDPTRLRDGPEISVSQDVNDTNGDLVGSFSVDLPAFTFDGDINYTFNIGAENNILYNFAYIVDSSGSMSGSNMSETRAAYASLTQSLIDQGIAARSQFAVIDFDSSATLYSGLDAQGAIAAVNGLSVGGGTSFGPALSTAEQWFESLATVNSATNIAYFLSDGQGSGASNSLQLVNEGTNPAVVDVRAFGIGAGADISSLGVIDSNSATILSNVSDLTDAFAVSGVDRTTIDHVDVLLNGVIVDTILPAQLTDSSLGLTFDGTIDNIPVVLAADQSVTFNLVFNDGTPTATIATRLSDGQSEVHQASADGSSEIVTLSVTQSDYVITGSAETVNANNLDNTIQVDSGDHQINGNEGNDRFILNGGSAVIDGGDGIDTVVFNTTRALAGTISSSGGILTVAAAYTLLNIEYLEFTDMRLDAATLNEAPEISIASSSVVISENDAGTTQATFTLNLSQTLTTDVTIDFQTADDSATQGTDYTATTGSVVIAAGSTSQTVSVDILDDSEIEEFEQFFVNLSVASGATFESGSTSEVLVVGIDDNDVAPGLNLTNNSIQGQNSDDDIIVFGGTNSLDGGAGSDFLAGGFQADQINGGSGNDVIRGEAGRGFLAGSDQINGGTGNDFLMGGRGADTFIFTTNDGDDVIAAFDTADLGYGPITGFTATATGSDFQSGIDHIQLAGFTSVDASNVMASVTDGADGAVFSAEGTSITFYGVDMVGITADDFIFV